LLFANKVRIVMAWIEPYIRLLIVSCLWLVISRIVSVCRITLVYSHKRSLKVVLFIVTGAILKIGYKTEQKPHNNNDE